MYLFPFKLFIHVTKLVQKWYKVNTVNGLDLSQNYHFGSSCKLIV